LSVGKNFSTNNVKGTRKASDFYETPYSLTELLLQSERYPIDILEPACGAGAIVRVLERHGYNVQAFDREVDFLKFDESVAAVITNPPFSLAKEFILKCKKVCDLKFSLLLPLSYLHGKERFDSIYQDEAFPLASVKVFTRYPMLGDPIREDGKHRTGMMVYAWYTWNLEHVGPPTIAWLDNHPFVIGKGD